MQNLIGRIEAMTLAQREALRAMLDERGDQVNVYPLSFAQRRMWFLAMMYDDSAVYSVPYAFRLTGRLDVDALNRALLALVHRHETLRTVFFDVDGVPYQTVQPETTFCLKVRRWRPEDEANSVLVQRLVDAEARRTFDLTCGPLIAATVLTTGRPDGQHLFMLTLHHIACDGWSMGILFRELEICYAAALAGRDAALEPLGLRYVDYARWQHGTMSGEANQRQLDYWRDVLRDPPADLVFPGRPQSSPRRDFDGDLEMALWPPELGRELEAASRAHGATPFMTLLALYAELLRRRSGADDLIVGTPMANRGRFELENLVGFFVNTLPLRIRTRPGRTLWQSVREIRTVTLEAQENQDVPLEVIVDSLRLGRAGQRSPLFQVSFIVQDQNTGMLNLPSLTVTLVRGHGGTTKFDLTTMLTMLDAELECMFEYRRAQFAPGYVRGMIDEMHGLLTGALAHPDLALSELPAGAGR